jgi:hypothetical protein
MSLGDLPHSVWSGTFRVYGTTLRCHVLSDGQRVIDADDVERLFAGMGNGAGGAPEELAELTEFIRWQRGGR